jgi:copper oxidase (laccase) domain-containing protein
MAIRTIISTKKDGNMALKFAINKDSLENKRKFFERNNIKCENTVALNVESSDIIIELTEEDLKNNNEIFKISRKADCIIARQKNILLYLAFGDCIPFVIYDSKQEILGFAHLGWQSIVLNLHTKIIDQFINKYNSNINDLEIILGPSAKKDMYILNNPMQLNMDDWKLYLNKVEDDNYQVDLNGYVVDGIKKYGITNISISDIDTITNGEYFSHHRSAYINPNEKEGRFIFGVEMI